MNAKNLTNSSFSNRRRRSFGLFSIFLAIAANFLIFLSISGVNRKPITRVPEEYTVIEVFRPQAVPARVTPIVDSTPVIVKTNYQPKPQPVNLARIEQPSLRPHLTDYLPAALLKQPGVSVNISAADSDSAGLSDISDALVLSQVDKPPKKISGAMPSYPTWAKNKRAEGVVILRFIVGEDGKVYNIKIHSITGDERFAETAKRAVQKWRFKPAIDNLRPVDVWCFQKINFQFID